MRDLRDAVSFHQLVLAADNASAATVRHYLFFERAFLGYLERRKITPAFEELNPTRVREFMVWYRNQSGPGRTRGGEVATRQAAETLKRLGQVLEDNEFVEVNPLRKLPLPRVAKHTRVPFTVQELSALLGACYRSRYPARDEALFLLLLDTGMRIGEACSIELDWLDLRGRTVKLMGKGRRERLIPFGNPHKRDGGLVARAVQRYVNLRASMFAAKTRGGSLLFLGKGGAPLTPSGGNDIIKRLAQVAGVVDAYPHRLRHTMATQYLTEHPGDELGLREILGHVNRAILADYVHLSRTTIAQRAGRASIAESLLG